MSHVDDRLHAMIAQAAEDVRCKVLSVGNAADHVHVLVRQSPSVALCTLVQRMKGRTSYELHIPWQVGYFAESISFADLERVAQYVRNQRIRHDASHPLEAWGALPD